MIFIDLLLLIIYILLIVLICVGIVLGIRLNGLISKAEKTLDNIDEKFNSFNTIVRIMNKVDIVKSALPNFVMNILKKRKEEKK